MKTKHIVIATVVLACIASPLLAKGGNGKGGGTTPVLSAKEASDLIFLREEEKLARDVYLALYDAWGTPIFLNISSSEQKHTSHSDIKHHNITFSFNFLLRNKEPQEGHRRDRGDSMP